MTDRGLTKRDFVRASAAEATLGSMSTASHQAGDIHYWGVRWGK